MQTLQLLRCSYGAFDFCRVQVGFDFTRDEKCLRGQNDRLPIVQREVPFTVKYDNVELWALAAKQINYLALSDGIFRRKHLSQEFRDRTFSFVTFRASVKKVSCFFDARTESPQV